MKHVCLIIAGLAITGCDSSKVERHEKVVDITDTRNMQGSSKTKGVQGAAENSQGEYAPRGQTGNQPTEVADDSRPIDRHAVGRYLANRWRIDDYAQCGYHMITVTAQLARSNKLQEAIGLKYMVEMMGEAKPYFDPTPDASLVSAALTQYRAFHGTDPVSVQSARLNKCIHDVDEAIQASRT